MYSSRKYHTSHTERIKISWGWGFCKTKKIEEIYSCIKLNWNIQKGRGVLDKIPSVGDVPFMLIFSGP